SCATFSARSAADRSAFHAAICAATHAARVLALSTSSARSPPDGAAAGAATAQAHSAAGRIRTHMRGHVLRPLTQQGDDWVSLLVRPHAARDEADARGHERDDDEREVERRRPPLHAEVRDDADEDDDRAGDREQPADDGAAVEEQERDADEE